MSSYQTALVILFVIVILLFIPLIFKLFQTLGSLDQFMKTAEKKLVEITEDVHAARGNIDKIAASLQAPIQDISSITQVGKETAIMVHDVESKIRNLVHAVAFVTGNPVAVLKSVARIFKKSKGKP